MIHFTLANTGETISIDPKHVSTVTHDYILVDAGNKSLVSGGTTRTKQIALISMENGDKFCVDDPNGTVTSQIEVGKKS